MPARWTNPLAISGGRPKVCYRARDSGPCFPEAKVPSARCSPSPSARTKATDILGREPLVRRDLIELVADAAQAGLYVNLITSGIRLEAAHAQYYGWALANRAALLPSRRQLDTATATVDAARARLTGRLVIG